MKIRKSWLLPLFTIALVFISSMVAPLAYAEEIVISANGSASSNEATINLTTTTSVTQSNNASILNNIDSSVSTGSNTSSENTGGDISIETGGIDTSVTVENTVNVSKVEVPCCQPDTSFTISENGSDSINEIGFIQKDETNIQIIQNADVTNNVQGSANTGNNSANSNTDGSIVIETGNIIALSNFINGPINIYNIKGGLGNSGVQATISGNGANSNNLIDILFDNLSFINVGNSTKITNSIFWNLNTGKNTASGNSGGDVRISTGDIFSNFIIKNDPINLGGISWGCCDIFDPGGPGDGGTPPGNGGTPSPPSDGGGTPPGTSPGLSGGSQPSVSSSGDEGGQTLLGLSATSSNIVRTLGMMLLSGGLFILSNDTKKKKAKR